MRRVKFFIVFLVMGMIFSFYPSMARAISLPKDFQAIKLEPDSPGAQICGKSGIWDGGFKSSGYSGDVILAIKEISGKRVTALYYTPAVGKLIEIIGEFDKNFEVVTFKNEKNGSEIRISVGDGGKMRLFFTRPGGIISEVILTSR